MTVYLSVLERLLAEATERPWEPMSDGGRGDFVVLSVERADVLQNASGGFLEPDAALICAAVNALPALIAAVKALREIAAEDWDPGYAASPDYHIGRGEAAHMARDALAAFSSEEPA